MNKSILSKGVVAACLMILAVPLLAVNSVHAGYRDWYNRSDSAYAINVYDTTNCSGTRHVVPRGGTYGNGQSYKVNAYSKFKYYTNPYSSTVPPNTCVRVTASYTTTVYVYPNN